jgi:hypothetical protein
MRVTTVSSSNGIGALAPLTTPARKLQRKLSGLCLDDPNSFLSENNVSLQGMVKNAILMASGLGQTIARIFYWVTFFVVPQLIKP